jgi:hemolysin III
VDSTASVNVKPPKPRGRGISHLFGAVLALCATPLLHGHTHDPEVANAVALYGVCLILLFAISSFYHVPMWTPAVRARLRRLDRSMIYVFVAGTYTPILVLLGDRISPWTGPIVWSAGLIGIVLVLFFTGLPRYVTVPPYLVMGWGAVAIVPEILTHFGPVPFTLILVGGLAYSIGAIIYARRSPNPAPRTFGYHEIFHLLVLVAATCHYAAIWSMAT